MTAILRNMHFRLAVLVIAIAGIVVTVVVVRHNRYRQDQLMTNRCANHAIQLKLMVRKFVEQGERFPLETDARSAFVRMNPGTEWPTHWLSSVGASCPESYRRDKSIGYVFVADGLPTKTVVEQSALVFFCPNDSHQRSEQHCHAVIGDGELRCLLSNIEMIQLIRREMDRARKGIVPYSTNALSRMEQEFKAREDHERKRQERS